jgi:hypothetical protein
LALERFETGRHHGFGRQHFLVRGIGDTSGVEIWMTPLHYFHGCRFCGVELETSVS